MNTRRRDVPVPDDRRQQEARLAAALLAALDDATARELAERLRPHLPVDPSRLLDVRQAAEVLGLHPDTLVRMARTGRIWATKVGREWRFRADRLEVRPINGEVRHPLTQTRSRRGELASPSSVAAIRGSTCVLRS